MGKSKTPSYIVEAPLLTTKETYQFLEHCRFLGCRANRIMVNEANNRLNKYYRDPEVKAVRKRQRKKGYKLSPAEKSLLKDKREEYGLSDYAFQAYLKVHGRRIANYLDANTVQKIATRVWQGASAVLFGKGRKVYYQDYEHFVSLEGKDNKCGMLFRNGCLSWQGYKVPIRVRAGDRWLQRALQDRVKYCRVVARWHNNHWRHYLQLVMEGAAPAKPRKPAVDGDVGLDLGPSAVALVSNAGLSLKELGDEINSIEAEIARLDRKLDRQRRANNPQNYDKLGRIKTLKKGERRVWNNSSGYYETRNRRRALYAKRRAKLKQSHEMFANFLLENVGSCFFVEKMSTAGLSKRSKETKTNPKTGRPYSKKRFGKSIANHAPSMFVDILTRKAQAVGGSVVKIDAKAIKASQYDHTDDSYTKAPLSRRWKRLSNGDWVQRDLYSAFLLSCLTADGLAIDQAKCKARYDAFRRMHDDIIAKLRLQKAGGKKFPQCMGI